MEKMSGTLRRLKKEGSCLAFDGQGEREGKGERGGKGDGEL